MAEAAKPLGEVEISIADSKQLQKGIGFIYSMY
jgi:hypothetical protein